MVNAGAASFPARGPGAQAPTPMKGSRTMLNVDRVWQRVSQLDGYKQLKLSGFILQAIVQNFTLTTGQTSAQTPVNFPAGMIILAVMAAANVALQAGTTPIMPGLDMFEVQIAYQATDRSIVGASRGMGSAVFGPLGDLFPQKELIIPVQGALLYTVKNLTTSTINVSFVHQGLVPAAIG